MLKNKIGLVIFSACLLLMGSERLCSADASSGAVLIEKMFDEDFRAMLGTPEYTWLQNGKIVMLDYRIEPGKQTFEQFDPRCGQRSPIADPVKILEFFKTNFPGEAPEKLEWPDAVDSMGKRVVYILEGDLFVVELENSQIKRLTCTPEKEESVTFSPDDHWISFIRKNDIHIIDVGTRAERKLTGGSSDTLLNGKMSWVYWEEIYDHAEVPYAWSPDSSAIAYLQTDDSPVSVSTFVHFKPATQEVVRQRYPKAGQPNPRVRLGIVEVGSVKTTWMDGGDYEYLARFNWLPDSGVIAVQTMNRRQSELKLRFIDRKTGVSRIILEEKQPAWINVNDALYFLKKNPQFIWMSERDGYQHLYLYRLDGTLIRQLTRGEFMVLPSGGRLTSGNGGLVAVDENREIVYFTSNRGSLKDYHLFRVGLDGKGLQQISSGNGVHAVEFSPDKKFYLDVYSSCTRPDEFSLYQADGKKLKTITPSAEELLAPWQAGQPEFHFFRADDGLELPVMMLKPCPFDAAKTKSYPAVIYVYGGPGAQQVRDQWNTNRILWLNLLSRQGFFCFVVEVRTGLAKSKASETSVYQQAYGMQNVKDILAAVEWIKRIPAIDPGRIGIWGGSGGGCTTLYTMCRSDVFKAGISLAPVSDWHHYDTIYTERYLNTPQNNPDGYRETSCTLFAHQLKGRLLIVHGTYDDNVHPQNTYAFIDRLIEHHIQFELMIYPWRKHGIKDYPARVHLYTSMLDFWKRNL